jgi:hypothetical protein
VRKKKARDIEARGWAVASQIVPAGDAPDDCLEIDELCLRKSPSFWVCVHAGVNAIIVSRQVGQVLGFLFGNRTRFMLQDAWGDVPEEWRSRPVFTDGCVHACVNWDAYGRFFPGEQHVVCEKGSGLTAASRAGTRSGASANSERIQAFVSEALAGENVEVTWEML